MKMTEIESKNPVGFPKQGLIRFYFRNKGREWGHGRYIPEDASPEVIAHCLRDLADQIEYAHGTTNGTTDHGDYRS